jgi:hypothetical protein
MIILLPLVLHECETWSLALREEHSLRVLRRISGQKSDEVMGGEENCIMSFVICTLSQV